MEKDKIILPEIAENEIFEGTYTISLSDEDIDANDEDDNLLILSDTEDITCKNIKNSITTDTLHIEEENSTNSTDSENNTDKNDDIVDDEEDDDEDIDVDVDVDVDEESIIEDINESKNNSDNIVNFNTKQDIKIENIKRNYRTFNYLTQFEQVLLLGFRTEQIINQSNLMIENVNNLQDPYEIAKEELRQKKIPFKIRRCLPDGTEEIWDIQDLICFSIE